MEDDKPQKYVPQKITNKNRTIEKMKKNKKKRDSNQKSIFPVNGIYILTELIKKQNQ